ncbi:MAG TPA: 4Fe-4S binding protein [Acidimicrobiales bacterium]
MKERYEDHPTVRRVRARRVEENRAGGNGATPGEGGASAAIGSTDRPLDANWLRQLCLDAGADDVGFVPIDHPDLAGDRRYIDEVLPGIATLIGFVVRTNRDNLRSPARATANLEFHTAYDMADEVGRRIARALQDHGVRAANPAAGFPQEMERFPDHAHSVPHKRVAVAAGLGQMGIHRNVIHPRFGNFVVLGTVVTQATVSAYGSPIDYNPCLECKLCVAVCPVGAIHDDGEFDFLACYTHNYREFMSGFTDWVHALADSRDAEDYRSRVSDTETVSMWQSLSFKADYKAAYCMAVCPAGEEVISPWLDDRRTFLAEIVRPLQRREETVYVRAGTPAAEHVAKRFPHKTVKVIG